METLSLQVNTSPQKSKAYYFVAAMLATIAVCPLFTIYFSSIFISDSGMERLITSLFFLLFILFLIIIAPSVFTFFSVKRNKQDKLEYYSVVLLCYVIGYIMIFYGTDKLINKQFVVFYKGLDTKLSDVDSYTLTWYYFGRSNVQVFIMGLLETIPALLLLFRKTRFIGAVLMLPVILNVLVTNLFNRISPFTLFAISLLTIFNVFIIYSYKNEIKELLQKINISRNPGTINSAWRIIIKSLKVVFWAYVVFFLGMKTLSYSRNEGKLLYGNGAYQLESLKINGRQISLDSVPASWYKKIYKEKDVRYTSIVNGKDSGQAADIIFYANNDSVKIASVQYTDYDGRIENANTIFKGSFHLANSELTMKGKQNGSNLEAIYHKLPFKDYNWWW